MCWLCSPALLLNPTRSYSVNFFKTDGIISFEKFVALTSKGAETRYCTHMPLLASPYGFPSDWNVVPPPPDISGRYVEAAYAEEDKGGSAWGLGTCGGRPTRHFASLT